MIGRQRQSKGGINPWARIRAFIFIATTVICGAFLTQADAQGFSFSRVVVEGNDRIEPATIVKFAGIAQGQTISAGELNAAVQRITDSGLFQNVELVPSGSTLIIRVQERPTINVVSIEGNRRLDDEALASVVTSQSRRVYSPSQAEADAAAITKVYSDSGRLAARVEPRIIQRDGNRVDLVFEVREGRVTEIERLSFTGNRSFSDRRLRQVLETKQAGIFRGIIQRDTYVGDRVEFDKQLLTDFYRSRGFIDFQILSVASEFSRERDAFFLTFNVREGLSYKFANITTISEYPGVDAAEYAAVVKIRPGVTYSPNAVDTTIARMEAIALRNGINFMNIEPRITRNGRNQTLDVVFALTKGPRLFVERIDIEGNATTLDRVIRRQFRTSEGDPFNPREIREAAERIRALDYFETADVSARQGTTQDQLIVDVDVEEKPTGSLTFGASYSAANGVALNVGVSEGNFLGRGQFVSVNLSSGTDNKNSSFTFIEPAFLDRDLRFRLEGYYRTTDNQNSDYSTKRLGISPSIGFPISEYGRLELRYSISQDELLKVAAASSPILKAEAAQGALISSSLGYTYSYDTRIGGIDPNRSLLFRFGQDFAGVGGDVQSITTTALLSTELKAFREEVTFRAQLEGGAVAFSGSKGNRLIDRFSGNGKIRGFEPNGIGPRDLTVGNQDALGGNYFAVARLEAEFPLGLPEEYGITGGVFADAGSVWGLDNAPGVDDSMHLRSSIGFSIFWTTAIGPLRLNFSKALSKETYDQEQSFDLTVSTRF